MDDDLDMSMDLGIGNVSLARSPPASPKKVSFDGGYQGVQQGVQEYARATQTPSQRCAGEVLTTGLQETGTWINGINGISGINGGNT